MRKGLGESEVSKLLKSKEYRAEYEYAMIGVYNTALLKLESKKTVLEEVAVD